MQLENLKTFCDLVEFKSFSRAAERNFISQSAVSQQIAQLEMEYKCKLLDRKTRPFELTKAGHIFYNSSRKILEEYDSMIENINSLQSASLEKINLTSIFSIGMHTLQPYIKLFMSKYPNINIKIDYADAAKIYDGIEQGDIDFGIVAIPKKDKCFQVYPFTNEPLVLVCNPNHQFAKEKNINIHQLQMCDFIAFEKNLPSRGYIDQILDQYNVTVHTTMEFDNVETIKRAIEINSGVSILPETAVKSEVRIGTLVALHFSNENFFRPTGIILRKNKILSEPCKYLLNILRNSDNEDLDDN